MHEVMRWNYQDIQGNTYGCVVRYEIANGKKSYQPYFNGDGSAGIPDSLPPERRLFGLHSLRDKSSPVFIVEGEKCAAALHGLEFQAITTIGGCNSAIKACLSPLTGCKQLYIIADHDNAGEQYAKSIYCRLKQQIGSKQINIIHIPDAREKDDICDYLMRIMHDKDWNEFDSLDNHPERHNLQQHIKNLIRNHTTNAPAEWNIIETKSGIRAMELSDFQRMHFEPQLKLLDPWLTARSINMIFANRGVGKTFYALSCAIALATNTPFLSYKTKQPVTVLYLDGEMQATLMQQRLNALMPDSAERENLYIINPELLGDSLLPDMATTEGLNAIDELIEKLNPKVIFVDNLSTFMRSGKENEGESWVPIQAWAIKHRSLGRSIVFIHHTNKGGEQRGTHRKEDVMDTIIQLKRPEGYKSTDGMKFEIHFSKARSLKGEETTPIIATLEQSNGKLIWQHDAVDGRYQRVKELKEQGLSYQQIGERVGVSKGTVSKMLNKHETIDVT